MHRHQAMAWVVSVCAGSLRLSQAKTLSALVAAALHVQRVSLASIGRCIIGGTVKHHIKRIWRFCANTRVETADAMRGVVKQILRKRNKPLLISFDWTDFKQFQTLMAAAVFKGRSIPLCWASCHKHLYDGHRSRNAFEESLLLVLRSMIPQGQKVILLGDRGFGRTELARFCQRHGFDYVIRIQPGVNIASPAFTGKLLDYPVHKGICRLLTSVTYRAGKDPVIQHIVVRWVRNLPVKRDEPWFLMTSLTGAPAAISRLYGQRMTIEELFRDGKNKRHGWSLRDTQISKPDRLDRLLLILALAYLLLCGIGLIALQTNHPGAWTASSKNDCSVFTIGRLMCQRQGQLSASIAQILRAVFHATELAAGNWG